MLKGAYLLTGQSPETGAHSLMEHVYQLSSPCWSQQWEGKLTCNLETVVDEASTPAATKRTEIQALASKLGIVCTNFLTHYKPEWKILPHGHKPYSWTVFSLFFFFLQYVIQVISVGNLVCALSVLCTMSHLLIAYIQVLGLLLDASWELQKSRLWKVCRLRRITTTITCFAHVNILCSIL